MQDYRLKQAKLLGGWGSILFLLGVIPYIGFILSLAGLVMIIVANKTLSKVLNNPSVFKNTLWGILVEFTGYILSLFLVIGGAIGLSSASEETQGVGSLVVILGLILMYIFAIGGSYLLRNAFVEIGNRFNSDVMVWAGNLLFWGAILLILFGLGGIAMLIAWILAAVAYFTLPTEMPNLENK
jgi:uncharacterized membrane protein